MQIELLTECMCVFVSQVEWLELFMYKYEVLIKEPGFSANNEQ